MRSALSILDTKTNLPGFVSQVIIRFVIGAFLTVRQVVDFAVSRLPECMYTVH